METICQVCGRSINAMGRDSSGGIHPGRSCKPVEVREDTCVGWYPPDLAKARHATIFPIPADSLSKWAYDRLTFIPAQAYTMMKLPPVKFRDHVEAMTEQQRDAVRRELEGIIENAAMRLGYLDPCSHVRGRKRPQLITHDVKVKGANGLLAKVRRLIGYQITSAVSF